MYKVRDIVNYLLSLYPISLGSSYDMGKIGLQFGNMNAEVTNVMVCLDCTNDVIDQALKNNCNMIISHHPFMFSTLINCDYNSMMGQKLTKVFTNQLNIFSMHTNFDAGMNGMNDLLAEKIGMTNIYSLTDEAQADSVLRIGTINETTVQDLALKVKETFNEPIVKIIGKTDKKVTKIGVIGGSGAIEWQKARALGVECFITGEFRHNNMVEANELGYSLIEVSHYVESECKDFFYSLLTNNFKDLNVILAEEEIPFQVL